VRDGRERYIDELDTDVRDGSEVACPDGEDEIAKDCGHVVVASRHRDGVDICEHCTGPTISRDCDFDWREIRLIDRDVDELRIAVERRERRRQSRWDQERRAEILARNRVERVDSRDGHRDGVHDRSLAAALTDRLPGDDGGRVRARDVGLRDAGQDSADRGVEGVAELASDGRDSAYDVDRDVVEGDPWNNRRYDRLD
jgi:hypothetical protein